MMRKKQILDYLITRGFKVIEDTQILERTFETEDTETFWFNHHIIHFKKGYETYSERVSMFETPDDVWGWVQGCLDDYLDMVEDEE
jgi:hypothetical protein